MNHLWLRRPKAALIGIMLALGATSSRAQDGMKTIEIDLTQVEDERKIIKVPTTQGRVKVIVKGAHTSNDIWQFVFRRLLSFRKRLELGVEQRRGFIENEIRRQRASKRYRRTPTMELYNEAKRFVDLAGKKPDAFWQEVLHTEELFPVREFYGKPEAGAYRTIRIDPCYRLEDLERLMKLLVQASQTYVKIVDRIEQQIQEEEAAQERARRAAAGE